MKNFLSLLAISISLVIIIAVGINVSSSFVLPDNDSLGGYPVDYNSIPSLTSFATSTGSYCATCPVKLLDKNSERRYVKIQNNSNTVVYLVATTTDLTVDGLGGTTATSTITALNGIRLTTVGTWGSEYIIESDNMIYGNLWATSTAATKEILINYYER